MAGQGGQWPTLPAPFRLRRPTPADARSLACVQLETALTAYAGIFPSDAPEPTVADLERQWQTRVEARDGARAVCIVDDARGGEVVGSVVAEPDPDRPGQDLGHLSKLYVLPHWWGRGLGRALHDAAVADLVDQDYARASLLVLEGNTRAQVLYARWGWHPTGERQPVLPGVDDLRFERDLPNLSNPPSVSSL